MSARSVIVIGAGLAGLSTGCYAQMAGYHSHILEHHAQPGGVAASWKRDGYLIDGGIHFVMGHRPGTALHDLYCELGVVPATHFIDVDLYGQFVDEASGHSLVVTHDIVRLGDDLKALSPGDAPAIENLIAGGRAMRGLDMAQMGMSRPSELTNAWDNVKAVWSMRRVLRYMTGRFGQSVADYTRPLHHPWLRSAVERLFMPDVPVWFVMMLLGLLADRQLGLLEGGCPSFVLPIEKRYKDLGGQVTYKATVTEILVENDRAVGVRLNDGSERRADVIVSTADGYSTIYGMLGGSYVDEETRSRYADWKLIRPMVMVSFGVNHPFTGEPWLSMINLRQPLTVGGEPVHDILVRIFNYSGRFAPEGKTVVQVTFDTEWEWWNTLQKDRQRYDAEKERVAGEVLRRLEAHYPGISSLVEMTDVATPYTTWRYTLNRNGAYMGWLPTPEALRAQLPRTLPGLASLYMAGQWVMPGGGVPACLYSGRHAVQLLCHDDNRPFATGLAQGSRVPGARDVAR